MLKHFRDQLRAASGTRQRARFTRECSDAIFFARFEASSFSRSEISLEHMLLGLLRSDAALRSTEDVVQRIEASEAMSRRVPPIEDLPLDAMCKLAIKEAFSDAQSTRERITTRHLMKAIQHQNQTPAARLFK